MFNIPVTVVVAFPERVAYLPSSIDIDRVAYCKKLLDNVDQSGVYGASSPLPQCEIGLNDGRKLAVVESQEHVLQYLDAYRSLEDFFTQRACGEVVETDGNVVALFPQARTSCDTSRGLTPD